MTSPAPRRPASGRRIYDAPAYILHASAWRETSLIVQAFTRDHGRVVMVAKGAKRPYSVLRPVLVCFQPLLLSWSGQAEVRTLTRAESGPVQRLGGEALMAAWYLNELILRLLPREDAHPGVYVAYEAALSGLAVTGCPQLPDRERYASVLRRFEWILLEQAGYGLEGPMPDFDAVPDMPALRKTMRARLDAVLDTPLRTRRILQELQRY